MTEQEKEICKKFCDNKRNKCPFCKNCGEHEEKRIELISSYDDGCGDGCCVDGATLYRCGKCKQIYSTREL